ncbi:hypothetical protein ROHU_030194 [Labeo rohita]|uniref:Uncharacterized protein n=1 Tax=Labeo rohita TaxID=84645 RepID=A0A498LS20_LABRO|nr:hypothetical protein ROHU_030194 [Labeo rohita]
MPAKGNLPANIQKTGLKKDTTGGEPQDCGRCGSWHSRQGDEANPQGQPAHYKVRERSVVSSFGLCSLKRFGAVADAEARPQADALRLER